MQSRGGLAGCVAVITGAGSGIGRATAVRFAAAGAAVAVLDIDGEAARATADAVSRAGGRAVAHAIDVAEAAQVDAAVEATAAALGGIDVLVNNAGTFGTLGSVADVTEHDWDRCMAVNVKGVQLCTRAALLHLGGRNRPAAVVNVASVAGLVGVGWAAAYCASKGAVIALTRQMALDLGPKGIRVNAICPGTVLTPMSEPLLRLRGDGDFDRGVARTVAKYPLGRLGTPDEIAAVALFLASDDASFLTGAIVTADGGMSAG